MPTTLEELPAGFWDDEDDPTAPPPAAVAAGASQVGGPPALASLQGLALLQAVFPGRVTKIERAASTDDDAAPTEPTAVEPGDAPDDDLDPGADALPPTPEEDP